MRVETTSPTGDAGGSAYTRKAASAMRCRRGPYPRVSWQSHMRFLRRDATPRRSRSCCRESEAHFSPSAEEKFGSDGIWPSLSPVQEGANARIHRRCCKAMTDPARRPSQGPSSFQGSPAPSARKIVMICRRALHQCSLIVASSGLTGCTRRFGRNPAHHFEGRQTKLPGAKLPVVGLLE